jgi:polyketide cyclase/dehydrase/lipid transport protein
MERAYVSTTLGAGLATSWAALGDFHHWPAWTPRLRTSVAEGGSGVGSVRALTLEPDGRQVRERLVHHDPADHRFSYEFDGTVPYPVAAYRGTVRLLPITDAGTTFLEWSGDFDAEPGLVDDLRARFTAVYTAFAGDLRAYLATP